MYRYGALFRPESRVSVCKVQFGDEIGLGLVAKVNIPGGTYILETCSSISNDLVEPPGPSIIEKPSGVLGLEGHHSILGPFRLVNHDCSANSQVSETSIIKATSTNLDKFCGLKKSRACAMIALRNIDKGEEITVKYNRNGYYGEHCMCSTCRGTSTRKLLRPVFEKSNEPETGEDNKRKKRKGHRGGKNRRAKRIKSDNDNASLEEH